MALHTDDIEYPVEDIARGFRDRYRGETDPSPSSVKRFRRIMYDYFERFGRDFPWRRTTDPYRILISEIMLQQTQTERVIEKYREFIRVFPSIRALARAPLRAVLAVWQGLGYNRRGLLLHRMAQEIAVRYRGRIPDTPEELITLPGIGAATAGSIAVFAFNRPVIFIETNIRTVFLHFFFPQEERIPDEHLLPLIERTLDKKNPRRWYSALMDYGSMLKKSCPNPSRRSAHYQRQTPFEGSRRQIRGLIVRTLLQHSGITVKRIAEFINRPEEIVQVVMSDLLHEQIVTKRGKSYTID
jgi:A/G-specific adenine glycosylase